MKSYSFGTPFKIAHNNLRTDKMPKSLIFIRYHSSLYSGVTLVVLDQVAKLLYLPEQALELIRTFENNPHKGAARSMRVIVEFANKASSDLMEALFHAESKRSIALTAAIDFALSNVQSAIAAAKKLAIMEQARTEHSGTVISHDVLPILELLHNEWASVSTNVSVRPPPSTLGYRTMP